MELYCTEDQLSGHKAQLPLDEAVHLVIKSTHQALLKAITVLLTIYESCPRTPY